MTQFRAFSTNVIPVFLRTCINTTLTVNCTFVHFLLETSFMLPTFLTRAAIAAFAITSTSRQSIRGNMASISSTTTTSLKASTGSASSEQPAKQYIVRYDYASDVLERRGPYREEHLALAKRSCISGGPTASTKNPSQPTGALFIFPDSLSAMSFVDNDPYVSAGIVTEYSVEEWTVAIQN